MFAKFLESVLKEMRARKIDIQFSTKLNGSSPFLNDRKIKNYTGACQFI